MPVYSVSGPDGYIYDIEGPENANPNAILNAAKRFARERELAALQEKANAARTTAAQPPAEAPRTTFGGQTKEFFKGLIPGAVGLGESAATGLAALLPEKQEQAVRSAVSGAAAPIKEYFKPAPGYEESVPRKFSEALGSTAPFLVAAPFTGGTSLLALGARAGIAGLGAAAGAGEARQMAEASGATKDERAIATVLGAPVGLLDMLLPELRYGKTMITRAAVSGGVEGATEAAQRVAQNAIAKYGYNPNQALLEGSGEEGAYGAGVGVVASLLMDAALGRKGKGAKPAAPTEEKPKEEKPFPTFTGQPELPLQGGRTAEELAVDRTRVPRAPTKDQPQGDLFPVELNEARAKAGLPSLVQEPEKPAVYRGQEELPLEGGRTAEELAVDRQRVPQAPTEGQPQGDLFPVELREAREAAGLPALLPEKQPPQPEPRRITEADQMALPLEGGQTAEEIAAIKKAEAEKEPFVPAAPGAQGVLFPQEANAMREMQGQPPLERPAPPPPPQPGQQNLFPADESAKGNKPPPVSTSLTENVNVALRKLVRGEELTRAEVGLLATNSDVNPELLLTAKVQPAPFVTKPEAPTKGQTSLFNPKTGKPTKAAANAIPSTPVTPTTGASTSVPSQPQANAAPAGASAPAPNAVEIPATPAGPTGTGETVQPSSLGTDAETLAKLKALIPADLHGKLDAANAETFAPAATAPKTTTPKTPAAPAATAPKTTAPATEPKAPAKPEAKKEEPKVEVKPATPKPEAKKEEPKVEAKKEEPKVEKVAAEEGEEGGNQAWEELATPASREFHDQISHAYTTYDAEEVGDDADQKKDRAAVQGLLRNRKPNSQTIYFSKMKRVVDNLRNIAFDIAFPFGDTATRYKRSVGETDAEANFFNGMGHDAAKKAAKWVFNNLSLPSQIKLKKMVAEYERQNTAVGQAHFIQTVLDRGRSRDVNAKNEEEYVASHTEAQEQSYIEEFETADEKRDRLKADAAAKNMVKFNKKLDRALDAIFGPLYKIRLDPTARLGLPLHPVLQGMLKDGNLKGVLNHIAANSEGATGKIAGFLSRTAGTTKVEVTDNLVDEAGKAVPGYFDPKTNTIYLDSATGMNSHVLLHEATHSALSHELDNPSSPHARQLNKLFNDLKPLLGDLYAAQDVHEFTSEAWSNMEFRQRLNSIRVANTNHTAWDRFTNKVGNWLRSMVGMETKTLDETALSAADRLIETLISPSPETRNVGVLYKAAATGTGAKVVANAFGPYGKFSTNRPGVARNAAQFYQTAKEGFLNGAYQFADLQTLVDIAKGRIPQAQKVIDVIRAKARYQNQAIDALKPVVSKAANWAKSVPAETYDRFNKVVYGSTLSQVDPSKPRDTYDGDKEKLQEYDRIKADYNLLGKEGQETYKMMRNAYRELYKKIQDEIGNRIDDVVSDPATAKKLKDSIFKKLVERGGLEPYFPLVRKGKYRLSYNAPDGEMYIEHFENKADRTDAIEELKKRGATEITPFSNISEKTYRKAPPTSFVNQILTTMEAKKVDPTVIDSVIDMYLNTLPETSFARAFHTRQGTLGFRQDAIADMQEKVFSTSAQIANIKYASILGKLDTELNEAIKTKRSDEGAVYLGQKLREHISESMNPTQLSTASRVAAGATYAYTLGFNISSALVQTAQLPIVVYTNFASRYGPASTTVEMTKAIATFLSTGFTRKVSTTVPLNGSTLKEGQKGESITVRGLPSLDNVDFDKVPKGSPLKSLETLAKVARSQNALARSGLYDIFDAGRSDGAVARASGLAGLPFHMIERFNRQVSMITAYNLELKRLKSDKATDAEKKMSQQEKEEFAANNAIYLTDFTNGGTGQETASLLSRQSEIGHVTTMYKRYGASMYRYLFKTMQTAYAGADPEERSIAQKQIVGVVGMSALLAGVQGVPMFDIAAAAYNTLWKGDDEDDFETMVRKAIGESYYKGLLTYLTGSEIGSRIGFNGLIYRAPRFAQWSDDPIKAAVESLGGPVFGVAQRIFDGAKKVSEGEVERGIEQMAPAFLSNFMKANRYDTEGFKTMRGDEVTSKANGYEVAMQMMGFAPQRYMEQIQQNTALKAKDKYVTEQKTKLLRQLYVAMRESDSREYDEVLEKLRELGEKHPGAVTADTIISSLKANAKTSAEMYHGITMSKSMRAELMADASEYSFSDDELED